MTIKFYKLLGFLTIMVIFLLGRNDIHENYAFLVYGGKTTVNRWYYSEHMIKFVLIRLTVKITPYCDEILISGYIRSYRSNVLLKLFTNSGWAVYTANSGEFCGKS